MIIDELNFLEQHNKLKLYTACGIINGKYIFYREIYLLFVSLRNEGMKKMDAYYFISYETKINHATVRNACKVMQQNPDKLFIAKKRAQ